MTGKTHPYPYQRLGGRRPKSVSILPFIPKRIVKGFLLQLFTWETVCLLTTSFFVGRAVLAGGLIPFPAALLAAVMVVLYDRALLVLIGTGIGLLTVSTGYVLGATMTILVLLFIILSGTFSQFRQKWYGVPVLVAGVIVTVKAGIFAYFAPDLYNYLIAVFEAVLAGCAAFLFSRTLPIIRSAGNLSSLKKEEIVGGAVLIIAVLTGMSDITVQNIEIKNVVARDLVMLAAYIGGGGLGAAMGTLAGMVPNITSIIAPGVLAIYSFSGLTAGLFRGFGRLGIVIGFVLGNFLLSIYLTDYIKLLTDFTETALAVAVFMLIPSKRLFAIKSLAKSSLQNTYSRSAADKKVKEITSARIRDYSRIFRELSQSFNEVSCDSKVYEENNLQNLFNGVATKVCRGCSMHRVCWDQEFYKTYRTIMDMIASIETNGRLTEDNVPPVLQKRCARSKELAITVNCLFETYKQSQMWQRKLNEGRDIISGQLDAIALMMQKMSNEVRIDVRMREDIETILRTELVKAGYTILDLSVLGEANGFEVNISCPSCGGKLECVNGIAPLVTRILSQPLSALNANYCAKKTGEPICEFKLLPNRSFRVESGFARSAKDPSNICGDTYSTIDLKDGKFAVILSDGMGVGPKAAVESRAAVTMMEKMLEIGFDKNLAVKTVNSSLILNSPDETITTIDLAEIDLMKGSAEFVKVGSAPSFVKRNGQVSMIRSSSLPLGILNNIEVDSYQQPIGHDDILVVAQTGSMLSLPGGVVLTKSYRSATLTLTGIEDEEEYSLELNVPGVTNIPGGDVSLAAEVLEGPVQAVGLDLDKIIIIDLDRIALPLKIRTRKPGDWFRPAGRTGSKKLKKFLIDNKIPRQERRKIAVLVTGDDQVVWLVGVSADERWLAGKDTKRALKLQLIQKHLK